MIGMRDPNRIDVFLKKLGEYWKQVPNWRFGQLIDNIMKYAETCWPEKLFFIEDEQFEYYTKEFFEKGDE